MQTFGWLDHSEKERRKVLDAIHAFKETETRDELGIASIRDSLADLFFPGTSVLQTRARYFLFIPWMYMGLGDKARSAGADDAAREAEGRLIDALGDAEGNIGKRAKQTLRRFPSNIYWLGLSTWGIRTFQGSQPDYHRFLERGIQDAPVRNDDDEIVMGSPVRAWHPGVPKRPKGFPKEATFDLTHAEAEYLRDRIRLSAPGSLLALLFDHPLPDVGFAWQHPKLAALPPDTQTALAHARRFADVMQGAALLYNLLLAEAGRKDLVAEYRERLSTWTTEVQSGSPDLAAWDLPAFWATVARHGRVTESTRRFVEDWIRLRTWEDPGRACDDVQARALVSSREKRLKGSRARLVSARALELWNGQSGTAKLGYRWTTALRLVGDVVDGLAKEDAPHA